MDTLKVVCAWCKAVIREGSLTPEGAVSHGLCPKCQPIYFPKSAKRVLAEAHQ